LLDYQSPILSCPDDTIVGNDAGKNTSSVRWNFTFTDNSLTENEPGITEDLFDIVLTINDVNVDAHLPKLLGIGINEMKYVVTDVAGNSASCTFHYYVNGKQRLLNIFSIHFISY